MERERRLTETFVTLADTLVDDFDVVELMQTLVEESVNLLDAQAAGLVLADQRGGLQVMASSSERSRLLELFQVQNDEGPCLECYRTGEQILVGDISAEAGRWPKFTPEAARQGFASVHSLPLRLRTETIGALNLFHAQAGSLLEEDIRVGQALASVATIGILQERAIQRTELLSEQLQRALNSRVIIEQAKGVLAERGALDMDVAFASLRGYARSHNLRLAELARGVVEATIDTSDILRASEGAAGS
jgi:transcriptional regulator with GAF, ATPase, and Fis domain